MNRESYNKIVSQWVDSRNQSHPSKLVYKFAELIKENGSVLDIGCGSGMPVAAFLQQKGFAVTGIDISEEMIKIAKRNLNKIKFLLADVNDFETNENFDGIVAWDSIFHLTPDSQLAAYEKIYALLKPKGYLLFTGGKVDGEIIGEMYGASFYYASIEAVRLKQILKDIGFEIILFEQDYIEGDMDRGLVGILRK